MRGGRSLGIRVAMAPPPMGRRRTASCLRTALFLFLATFVWLQLHVASLSGGRPAAAGEAADTNDTTAAILSMVPQVLHKFRTPRSRARNGSSPGIPGNGSDPGGSQWSPANISDMRRSVARYNEMQSVLNEDVFGPLHNDSLVIVVQVHTRINYLRHLIVSLAQARHIEETLLVFSHDHFDEDINDLVRSVDFCKVLQLFYPFSVQLHPGEFPGESPGDCPRNMRKEQAQEVLCTNAMHPDLYGHYREAKFTQTKHHWWWKANRVFNQLEVTRNHSGLVLFLEEDHYVAEDFIHVLRLMERTCRSNERCNILSLGTYLKTYNYYGDSKKRKAAREQPRHQDTPGAAPVAVAVAPGSIPPSWGYHILPTLYQHYHKAEVTPWVSSKHNMGMAFNRSTWGRIRSCSPFFCTYDDYNWDWSLQHLSTGCLGERGGRLQALVLRGPRVFHIGECGVHHKKANCQSPAVISKVQQVLRFASRHLYPGQLTLTLSNSNKKQKLRKGNGGWGDVRDHQLCANMTRGDS